jgi:hypothetical protein
MSDVFIGEKGKYDWTWDLKGSLVYLPKFDVVLITRFFTIMGVPEESVANEITIALFHESLHQSMCKLVGENESRAFDNVPYFNMEIEKWLGWR